MSRESQQGPGLGSVGAVGTRRIDAVAVSNAVDGPPLERRPEAVDESERQQMSLGRRLRQRRTILSIAVPLAVIIIAVYLNHEDLAKVPGLLASADPWLLLVAFASYYIGFPIRGTRWAALLKGAGYRVRRRDATEIVFLSWLVNCIVPAKLGDVYRAYLLKLNSPVSATKTLGTIFTERVLDIFAIAILGLAAGFWRFRTSMPGEVQVIFALGVAIVVLMALALIAMRSFGRRVIAALPFPHRVLELYERFEEGVFRSVGARGLPWLGLLTVLVWMSESFRLYFVVLALGFQGLQLGFSGVVFVALIGSLLTAIPLTPAGLGAVEIGMGGVLIGIFGVSPPEATAMVLLDRSISVFSVVVLGAIAYVLSSKPRGAGIHVEPAEGAAAIDA